MNISIKTILIFSIILCCLSSCDEGLAPPKENEKSFITGLITYVGGKDSWFTKDSVKQLRVVAFKNYPPTDIFAEIFGKRAYLTQDSLPKFVDTSSYIIEIPDAPVELKYIVVALQYGDSILVNWMAIGVYTKTGDNTQPSSILLKRGQTESGIDINIDFKNLPPQPF